MSSQKLTKEQVEKIATLVKLNLSEDEKERLAGMFSETLDYIKVLDELNTSGVKETYQVNGLTNIFQKDDENKITLTQKEALQNADEIKDNLFVTKGVFDRE